MYCGYYVFNLLSFCFRRDLGGHWISSLFLGDVFFVLVVNWVVSGRDVLYKLLCNGQKSDAVDDQRTFASSIKISARRKSVTMIML